MYRTARHTVRAPVRAQWTSGQTEVLQSLPAKHHTIHGHETESDPGMLLGPHALQRELTITCHCVAIDRAVLIASRRSLLG